jgi:hypothetical protein
MGLDLSTQIVSLAKNWCAAFARSAEYSDLRIGDAEGRCGSKAEPKDAEPNCGGASVGSLTDIKPINCEIRFTQKAEAPRNIGVMSAHGASSFCSCEVVETGN